MTTGEDKRSAFTPEDIEELNRLEALAAEMPRNALEHAVRFGMVIAARSTDTPSSLARSEIGDLPYWQAFLDWNRAQPKPLVEIGAEYAVAQVAARLLATSVVTRGEVIQECRKAVLRTGMDAHEAAKAKDATDYLAGYQDCAVDADEALRDLLSPSDASRAATAMTDFDSWFKSEYGTQGGTDGTDGLKDLLREAWTAALSASARAESPEHVEDVYLAVRIAAERSNWKRDSGETLAQWVDRTFKLPSASARDQINGPSSDESPTSVSVRGGGPTTYRCGECGKAQPCSDVLCAWAGPATSGVPPTTDSPLPSNGAVAHNYAKLKAALAELLRLYDWRNDLGRIERDFNHNRKQMTTWLNQYGREKKQAWAVARETLTGAPEIDVLLLHERIQAEAHRRLASASERAELPTRIESWLPVEKSAPLTNALVLSVADYPERAAEKVRGEVRQLQAGIDALFEAVREVGLLSVKFEQLLRRVKICDRNANILNGARELRQEIDHALDINPERKGLVMSYEPEEDDGMCHAGLVPTAQERAEESEAEKLRVKLAAAKWLYEEACRHIERLVKIVSATPAEAFKGWAIGEKEPYEIAKRAEAFRFGDIKSTARKL